VSSPSLHSINSTCFQLQLCSIYHPLLSYITQLHNSKLVFFKQNNKSPKVKLLVGGNSVVGSVIKKKVFAEGLWCQSYKFIYKISKVKIGGKGWNVQSL